MNIQSMQSIILPGASNFKFSAVRPDDLGASEYTLVTIAVDVSSSVTDFAKELKSCVQAIIEAARQSPRADNLLVRLVSFDSNLQEIFGFKTLRNIKSSDIDDFSPEGMTALYDASDEAISATEQYAKLLYDQEFDVNAAVYVITDGWDTASCNAVPARIADKLKTIRNSEKLESIVTLLIGVNTTEDGIKDMLEQFASKANFDQFIDAGDANAATLAKIAGYVSKSIASQSQSLGSGAPSQVLSF